MLLVPTEGVFGVEVPHRPKPASAGCGLMIEIVRMLPAKIMSTSLYDKKELTEIRKESLDIYNRIHSIAEDALFVEKAAKHYDGYPIIRAAHFLSLAGPDSNRDLQQT